jgi:hypothetical protein
MDGEKSSALYQLTAHFEGFMAALLEAITVKRKMYFEFENAPYYCIDAEVSTPTARGGAGEVQRAGPGDGGGELSLQ